jgi:hypothetical protein
MEIMEEASKALIGSVMEIGTELLNVRSVSMGLSWLSNVFTGYQDPIVKV